EDVVAELVREHVEVLAVRPRVIDPSGRRAAEAEFEEAVAGLRVVPLDERDELELLEVSLEEPRDRMAEVVLPDIERAADGRVHRGAGERARVRIEVIEVTGRSGRDRRILRAVERRLARAVVRQL